MRKPPKVLPFFALKGNILLEFHEIHDFMDSIHVRRAQMGQQKLLFRVISSCADATSAEKCPLRFCHRYNGFLKKSAPDFHGNRQRIPHFAESSRSVTFFCFKNMIQMDFRPTARGGGRKKYLKRTV